MRKLILALSAAFLICLNAAAQNIAVSGKVTSDKNVALEGVTVASVDGKYATQTDKDGKYSLSLPTTVKTLIFSLVSYQTVNRPVRGGVLNISLTPSDVKLEEVVVVGYGVQQRKAFTGSSAKVGTGEIAQLVTPSIDKELAGRAAGVNVNVSSGQVNAPARIRIRGTNSFNQNRSPLVVVDGSPISTGNLGLISNTNALGDINPDDVASIEVLKDGSATAIYGSRGANGVIMITTKKGSRGKNSIAYSGIVGFSSPVQKFDLLNASQFVTIANEKFVNAGQLPPARIDPAGTNTDWQNNIFVNNALANSHTVSLSGGSDRALYYMSMNYSNNNGIVRTNKTTAYRVRANLEVQANKWLKMGNSLSASRQNDFDQNNSTNGLSGAIVGAIRALPNVPIYSTTHATGYNISPTVNSLGQGVNLRGIDDNYTNIAFVLDNNKYNSDQYRILDNLFAEVSLAKGLKFRSQVGIDYYTDNSLQAWDPRHGDGASGNGYLYQGQQNIMNTNIQNYLNYNATFNHDHSVFVTVGHELQQTTSRYFRASGTGISDLFYAKENIISGTIATPSIAGSLAKSAIESLFGRINYDYKGKYFVQASIRRDGQSSLAKGNKYGVFPGASIGWRPSEEAFWKSTGIEKVVSDLKLRASYANVGNRLSGFPYLSTYGSSPYANTGGLAPNLAGNASLQWEESKKYDFGADLSLFKGKANITFDYFKNDLDKLVLDVPTPYSTGIPNNTISQNIGRVQNKGFEISIDATVYQKKDFRWGITANYTHVTNKIISLFDVGGVPTTSLVRTNYNVDSVGLPISSIFGYEFAGVNSGNGNPVYYNAARQLVQRNVSNGTYYFANSMSDPTLGAVTTLSVADKRILGSSQPTGYGAFINSFSYKALTLDVMFRYQYGNKIINITRQEILLNQKFANGGKELLSRWTTPGQVTDVPKLWYAQDAIVNQNGEAISRFVENGNFLKLQNISLSYDFSGKKIQELTKSTIKAARLYIQAQNIYTWTKYRGIDPEAYSEDAQDNAVSPQVRNVSVGVNVTF
ncbi:SusC/RagA family TonB-linked outer membrane protein [Ferruginibacter sp.]